MRLFYLLSAAAAVAATCFFYIKVPSKDGEHPSSSTTTSMAAGSVLVKAQHGLTPEQIRNREQLIRNYEQRIKESRSTKEKKDLQEKIEALKKEISDS